MLRSRLGHLEGDELVATLLKPGDNLSNKVALNPVGL